ncbi:MAG TPA: DUF3307 domain-containing protein [Bacillus sp. (in: firmicutes)]|nr:DUF3307 domain-containing protein [Bacillus sp. (in: firmicutes)]
MIKILLLFILAHLMGDFITQSKYINKNKEIFKNKIYSKGLFIHVLHHICLTNLLFIIFREWTFTYFMIIFMVSVIHYIIDYVKVTKQDEYIELFKKKDHKDKYWLQYIFEKRTTYFLADQFLHIVSIYGLLRLFTLGPALTDIYNQLGIFLFAKNLVIDSEVKIISFLIVLILVTYASAYLISAVLADLQEERLQEESAAAVELDEKSEAIKTIKESFSLMKSDLVIDESYEFDDEKYTLKVQYQQYSNPDNNSRGKYIGILERLLITIFVVLNIYQGLVLLGAIKTVSRFKQFEDKNFAEYYLLGTLLSLIAGITLGLLIKRII